MNIVLSIGAIAGGLGLFLLAMRMLTDGLKVAAGEALRDLLGKWTRTPMRGLITGMLITALVQSSSAVTVATIGFVNAGLLTLFQTLGVIFGSNIGTTMTGWLVALVGFKIKVELFSLPLIGLGMLLNITGEGTRRGALGLSLAGFGLFFIGVNILQTSFESLSQNINLQDFGSGGLLDVVIYLFVGFLLTLLTQSSSAAIAITLTATSSGLLPINIAAAMVIGANVGTTSTAVFSAMGATSNAKRVAAAHVIFNLITALVALLILPIMLWFVAATGKLLHLTEVPAVSLALFHTMFNVLGVILIWPVTHKLSDYLQGKFRTIEEDESHPKYLDMNIVTTPSLALNALVMELLRISHIVQRATRLVLSKEEVVVQRINSDKSIVFSLIKNIDNFIMEMSRTKMPQDVYDLLPKALQLTRYYEEIMNMLGRLIPLPNAVARLQDVQIVSEVNAYIDLAIELLNKLNIEHSDYTEDIAGMVKENIKGNYKSLKAGLFVAATEKRESIETVMRIVEQLVEVRRLIVQLNKSASIQAELVRISQTAIPLAGDNRTVAQSMTH